MAGKRTFGSIRKLPSGRFQVRYVHGPELAEHRARTTFTAKIDAEGWLSAERRLIERDEWAPPAERAAQKVTGGFTLSGDLFSRNQVQVRVETRIGVSIFQPAAITKVTTAAA